MAEIIFMNDLFQPEINIQLITGNQDQRNTSSTHGNRPSLSQICWNEYLFTGYILFGLCLPCADSNP